jgi:hypothetical protein
MLNTGNTNRIYFLHALYYCALYCCYTMEFGFDPSNQQQGISGKKLIINSALAIIGAFFIPISIWFSLNDLIRENVTEEAKVTSKNDSVCVIETSDHPRTISNCKYHLDYLLIVTYKNGTQPIENMN